MKLRIRQIPIELAIPGQVYLNVATILDKHGQIIMGPAVLEVQYVPNGEWLPVEFTK
jgi:hypothetical protein